MCGVCEWVEEGGKGWNGISTVLLPCTRKALSRLVLFLPPISADELLDIAHVQWLLLQWSPHPSIR